MRFLLAAAWACCLTVARGETLFASHYSGQVYTLQLQNTTAGYDLSISSQITGCGGLPSWLTYEPVSKALYCSDETMSGQGSISSFSAGANGALTSTGKAPAPAGGVANMLYGGSDGRSFIAIAHYQSSQVSTFKLPITSSSTPLQTFKFTLNGRGTIPSRQDAPHPHHVVVDPTGRLLLSPDLGADLIRVWTIASSTGLLTACSSLSVPGGTGPRHAAFRAMGTNGQTVMYVANELANTTSSFTVSYQGNGCPQFTQVSSLSPFPNNAASPSGTKVAEVHVSGNRLYSSTRVDKTFSGNDAIATFVLCQPDGPRFMDLHSSWGTYPRTFAINKDGTLLAVGDQTTANVAILSIAEGTGELSERPVANIRIGSAGTPENENGLSSVIFAD